MNSVLKYADPFWGTEETKIPSRDGIVSRWYFLKAQVGNCHPGACRPFGMVSVLPYSGAYPTGYGKYLPNSYGVPKKFYQEHRCKGFTHFQVSGTGSIGKYYNFVRVIPLTSDNTADTADYCLKNERAVPGEYSAELDDSGIFAQLTVGEKSAFHSYSFSKGSSRLAVDFLTCGLIYKNYDKNEICEATVRQRGSDCIEACLWTDFPLYVCLRFEEGGKGETKLLLDGKERDLHKGVALEDAYHHTLQLVYTGQAEEKKLVVQAAFSLKSAEQAHRNLLNGKKFEDVSREASGLWEKALSKIRISTPDEKIKRVFYSCLYHSMVKPCNFYDESPYWSVKKDFYVDFATMWDQYKTHLPLILTLFPDVSSGILNGLMNMADHIGEFPNMILMSSPVSYSSDQAICLAVYTIMDGYFRKVPDVDWKRALHLIERDFYKKRKQLEEDTSHITHVLDYAEACFAASIMAEKLGEPELSNQWKSEWEIWKQAYNPEDGLIQNGVFYEGNKKTYSFRLMNRMQERIKYFKSVEQYVQCLDQFFGYDDMQVEHDFQGISPRENEARGRRYEKFEGLNNESDMEAPYAYLYAGRYDRTAEIVSAAMRSLFDDTPNGAPGNNDSGALSSWYVWNTMGLFPVAGQNLILIGSPIVEEAVLDLGGKEFVVHAENVGMENCYVVSAELNGKPIDRAWITVDELMNGGCLCLHLSDHPSDFGKVLPQ